jgi:hypothetical protein
MENDHPGSIGMILKNLLAKVEETPFELPLPEKLPILRAGSIFTYPINEAGSQSDSSYGGVALTSSIRTQDVTIVHKGTLTAVKDCKCLAYIIRMYVFSSKRQSQYLLYLLAK